MTASTARAPVSPGESARRAYMSRDGSLVDGGGNDDACVDEPASRVAWKPLSETCRCNSPKGRRDGSRRPAVFRPCPKVPAIGRQTMRCYRAPLESDLPG